MKTEVIRVFFYNIHLLCIIQIIISLTLTYTCLSTWNLSASYYYLEGREYILPLLNSWTESDNIVGCTRASKCAVLVIISIAISLRALVLKDPRIVCGWASLWSVICTSATILWLIESSTSTLASNNASIRPFHLQLCWASCIHIGRTAWGLAFTSSTLCGYWNRQVEPIYKTNIIKVHSTIGGYVDFYQRSWRNCTVTIAWNLTRATFCSSATEPSRAICGALGSGPESAFPWSLDIYCWGCCRR